MTTGHHVLDERSRDFYIQTLTVLNEAGLPYLLGGAYALARYTGIERHTKDLDLFTRPEDAPRVLDALRRAGYSTHTAFPHWLGKAHQGDDFVDIIYSSANGVGTVDDEWFERATADEVFGVPVHLVPVEELLWHKAYVCERERFDGADVAHLIRAKAEDIAWGRLVQRFGPHWQLLFAHVMMFGFVYPGESHRIPEKFMQGMLSRLTSHDNLNPPPGKVCLGTLLSREQYLPDVERWGYADARETQGYMQPQDITTWTAAIGQPDPTPPQEDV
ncbi:nucleotidyltransferase family protein [Deinococcus maricopensis]|uniref:Nucleotidyltransferase family protein n=1 Tax=Deinococcus maricopensis (strain DSM 21211 / LMG 22137 / NRRL B-23946 / LB-34) TaxID=709986 RepID=E8U3A4_DEIML|nr:nucleotidyltransferase [Deinococcus maricopensis]ADV66049.1 hypothetical protein Deima_0389 [Deinococcus maricopensis DSM 21211]